jgi:lipopolysaccharide export system protein LptA
MNREATRPAAQRKSLMGRSLGLATLGFGVTSLAIMATGSGDPAQAQALANHNSNAPVDFAASSIEVQDRADRVVLSGNVVVRQAGLTVSAPRMTVAYSNAGGTSVNRLDATGGVTVEKGGDQARGNVAIYDLDRKLITMVGNVQLRQQGNNLNGGRLVIDLNSGRATVDGKGTARGPDGNAVSGGTGGRVTGTFSVPKRD